MLMVQSSLGMHLIVMSQQSKVCWEAMRLFLDLKWTSTKTHIDLCTLTIHVSVNNYNFKH